MSQDDQNLEPRPTRDSRLDAFLRQASAIIAAEKGLNNVAKAKLDELAQRLHLTDELFETGLQKLQDSNSPIGELTAYEQGFLNFLTKEFRRMPKGTVLSISIEEKAIAHAKEKFEIPAYRAEKLIEFQTRESGFGRMSRSDARDYGQQIILDYVGEQLSLDEQTEKKVFRMGRRWGCSQEEVEKLLRDKFSENRRAAKSEQRRPVVLGVATLVCVILIGGASSWLVTNREMIFGKPIVKTDPVPVVDDPVKEPVVAAASKSELEYLFPDDYDSLTSENSNTRGDAIANIANQIVNSQHDMSRQVQSVKSWFFKESNPAVANRLVQEVDRALGAEPETNRNDALGVPYRAAKMAIEISHANVIGNPNQQRAETLAVVLENQTGINWRDRSGAGANPIDTAIAIRQWNQLIQNAWTSPGRSSILVEPLSEITKTKLPVEVHKQFMDRSVRTVITADRNQWRNMRSPILDSIESADEVQRMEWVDVWLDQFDGSVGFREFTAPLLAVSFVETRMMTAREYETLLRSARSDWRNRQLRPALQRHQEIGEKILRLKPYISSTGDAKANPDLVFQAASAANLCLEAIAIAKAGRGGDDSAWSDVDVQLERFDQRLRDFVFLEEPQNNGVPNVSSAGFDTTARDRALSAFAFRSESNQASRLAAIERLPKIAARFDSIPQPMATALAIYLLSPIESEEWLQMQRVLPDLAKWPRLVLAISDQLPKSTAPMDQVMTMRSVLTGNNRDAALDSQWRDELSLELFKFAHESLMSDEGIDPNSSDSDWIRLEKYLSSSYYRRSILLGGDGLANDRSALNLAKQCVKAVSNNQAATERAIGLVEASTENEMEQIVLLNRLLTQELESTGQASLGTRLLNSELNLLMKWNQRRELQLKELLDEN